MTEMHRSTVLRLICTTMLTLSAVPAFAQEGDTADNEIIVTAQKRAQAAQDVPIALSAFGAEQIEQAGATDFKGLADLTPGFAVTGGSDAFARSYIRGIGTNDTGIGAEPSVGVYIDGVYSARIGGAVTDLVDVARVEVLKGPQGTLFGRNSIAGAISIVTNKPVDRFEAMAGAEYGRFNDLGLRGMINLPIAGDMLMVRAAGSYRKRDGWQANLPGGRKGLSRDRFSGQVKTLFRPAPGIDVTMTNLWSTADETAAYVDNLRAGGFAARVSALTSVISDRTTVNGGNDVFGNPANNQGVLEPIFKRDLQQHALNIEAELNDSLTLTSLTSFRKYSTRSTLDYDGTEFYIGANEGSREKNRTFSQELRLAGQSDAFDWFVGGSYSHERNWLDFTIGLFDFGPFLVGGPINGYKPFVEVTSSTTGTKSLAAFGDVIWHASDAFNVTVGARYSHDRKYIQFANPNHVPGVTGAAGLGGFGFVMPVAAQFVNAAGVPDPSLQRRQASWSNFSPRLVLDYRPNDDVMLYAGISRGYKSGAFNSSPSPITVATSPLFLRITPDQTAAVRPETATNIEGGIKSEFFDRKLMLNISAFYVKFTDLQVRQLVGTTNVITNAGKASNRGVEVETRLRVTPDFTLMANGTWMDAKYDRYFQGATNLSGTPLLFSPKLAGSIGADYRLDAGSIGEFDFYANYSFKGKHLYQEGFKQKGYGSLDARLTYRLPSSKVDLSVFGANLTNEKHIVAYSGNTSPFGVIGVLRNEPTTYGVSVKVEFD